MTDDITRRDVLRGLGGLALTGAIGCGARDPNDPNDPGEPAGEPAGEIDQAIAGVGTRATTAIAAVANRPIWIDGVEAYAQKSVAAGETIDFRVNSPVAYQLSIVRLGWDTDSPARDWTLYTFPQFPASQQPIHPGSYVHVEAALDPTAAFTQLTLECWVRPFRELCGGYWQGLMSQHTNPVGGVGQCGFGLFLTDANVPCFYFGDGGAYNPLWFRSAQTPLTKLVWHHVVAVFNARTARLYVDGVEVDCGCTTGFPAAVTPGFAPLRLGAYGDATGTSFFLDGDLAMPVIYGRALNTSEIAGRFNKTHVDQQPPEVPPAGAVIGCWPLDEEQGAIVTDVSGCGRTGTIVNRGTWMIGGPSARAVERHEDYNPDADATRGHGLRLSSKDLYDCGWEISHTSIHSEYVQLSYPLPTDCLPGVYVGRITYNTTARYDVTFVVRRAANRPCAPVLVLCSTTTWHAYNHALGLFSFYHNHGARPEPTDENPDPEETGQPTYYQGIEMPWANSADPYLRFGGDTSIYSQGVRAERFLHVWLEENGYHYDVISDLDLHLNPSILSNYQTVFIAGHSEYWSREGWNAVRSYLGSGGNMIVASGNTMFWRVSYNGSVIECRKKGQPDRGERPNAQWAELYHEHDHQRGGLMREAGCPGWQAIGVETRGYNGVPARYKVTNVDHPLFKSPEAIGVMTDDPDTLDVPLGGPLGAFHEWDTRLQAIEGHPEPPPGYTPVALAQAVGSFALDYESQHVSGADLVLSEIVEWKWASGGRVFAVGSIAAAQSLHMDEKMSALFRNALHHNGVVFRLNLLAIGQDGHFDLKSFDGSGWSTGWDDHGAGFSDNPPTGVQFAPNTLAAMAITSGGHFYYKYNVGDGWSPWNDFGGAFQGRPAAIGWGRNRLDLFARGLDNHLWHGWWDGSAWNGSWVDLGGGVASDPAAISWEGRRRSVAVRGTAGNILYRYNIDGTWSAGWTDLGRTGAPGTATFAYAPTMVSFGGNRLAVFAVDTAGRAWVKHWDGTSWYPSLTGWVDLGRGGGLSGRVHVIPWGLNGYSVFGVGVDGHLKWKSRDGFGWGPSQIDWYDLGGSLVGEPTVAIYRGSHVSVFGVAPDGRVQHLLWHGSAWSDAWEDLGGTMRRSPAVFHWVAT